MQMQMSFTEEVINQRVDDSLVNEVIGYLNKVTNKQHESTKEAKRLIVGQLKKGYSLKDMFKVVVHKTCDWRDTEYEKYLRP